MLTYLENWHIVLSFCWIFVSETAKYTFGSNDLTIYVGNLIHRASKHNILIVKFAQTLTKNPNLSKNVTDAMELYTHSAPFDEKEIDITVLNHIRQTYDIELPDKPIHSGMISVAYKGTMKDQEVIVKLKRTNIANKIRQGSENVTFIYNMLYTLSSYTKGFTDILAMLQVLTQTTDYLISQCDFEHEIHVLQTTQKEIAQYEHLSDVIVPTVYNTPDDIENTEFILMEYLDGRFSSEIEDLEERSQYLSTMVKFGLSMTWFFTYYHTDLHHGNVLCMKKDGKLKLGIIDFGMVLVLTSSIRGIINCIVDMNAIGKSANNTTHVKLINLMFDTNIDDKTLNEEQRIILMEAMQHLAHMCFIGQLNESLVFKTVEDVNKVLNNKLVLNLNTFLLILSMAMANSVMQTLSGGDSNLIEANMNRVVADFME